MTTQNFVKGLAAAFCVLFISSNMADESVTEVQLAQLSDGFNAEETYMASCWACHGSGAAGAPKVGAGNAAAWDERTAKGWDALMANVVNGINAMPAKGLCFTCTDDDLRAVVEYMIESSQ
jgi:cytochrome c5